MLKAIWNDAILAESDDIVMLEGNAYFPRESLNEQFFEPSRHHSLCPWKGIASYLDVVAFGDRNKNAAWYYPHPSPLARRIKGRVAFWHGVRVQEHKEVDSGGESDASLRTPADTRPRPGEALRRGHHRLEARG
jgi:uncharacterized protein (DUF427 family)